MTEATYGDTYEVLWMKTYTKAGLLPQIIIRYKKSETQTQSFTIKQVLDEETGTYNWTISNTVLNKQ